ncbi:hypothetical protein, partial [Streptomyces alkaliterrae]|uniref:hypothetical protein n=1 Tax=Streptomyces alkaliterrae TaxID=2213162 RepID=UPI001E60782B
MSAGTARRTSVGDLGVVASSSAGARRRRWNVTEWGPGSAVGDGERQAFRVRSSDGAGAEGS